MKKVAQLRKDVSGVSEVVGTILILAMTVTLFSVIILWVTAMPTPVGQTRLDILSRMDPVYSGGLEIGVNITLVHQGGVPIPPVPTLIYVTSQRGSNPPQSDILILHAYDGMLANPNGLLDGTDSVWDIGERWAYKNFALQSSDQITVSIVDKTRSVVLWQGPMNAQPGFRPPVFIDKWTDGIGITDTVDPVQEGMGFYVFARVSDPDDDLDTASVYATITAWYGSGVVCEMPLQMRDDGVPPDRLARDGVFTLGGNVCLNSPYPASSWAGSVILLNASDQQGHMTTTRLVMDVVAPSTGGGGGGTIPSQLWQYIGYVQIRTGEAWVTNLNKPYATTTTFQPYRITATQLNGDGGPLFHLKMANHGNTTIFIDGWTSTVFTSSARASVSPLYVVRPVDAARPANAGGIAAYPGTPVNPNNFQYAQVFDIDPLNQEKGGTPTEVLAAAKSAFRNDWPGTFRAETLFINILISGMAGPANMTYQQIIDRWGPLYNPFDHLLDADRTTRTSWYAQVIPFIGMVVY